MHQAFHVKLRLVCGMVLCHKTLNLAPALFLEFACNDKTVQIKLLEVVVTKSRLGRIQFHELKS